MDATQVVAKSLDAPDAVWTFLDEPGHDAWVVGDEPCIALGFISAPVQ